MNVEKTKIIHKNEKPKAPRTIKDIEETLKEMDKIHNTSFYSWIKDENNVSVIAFKTKDLFQEHYEKQPELVYNALRFLCKDWKLSKIAELVLKLFYKCNVASEKLAIIIYEVSLLLENPEKVDLISLLLIGEEPKNVAFFLYQFFRYTEKKYREHTEIINEEEFLDEMNAFCSGILECLYSCLKWTNDYFRELILEYVCLSTLDMDARREFLIRMVNVKYSRFLQEIQKRKEKDANPSSEDVFKRSLNFGILVFNMYQVVMRTDIDDLLSVSSPTVKEISAPTSPVHHDLSRDRTMTMEEGMMMEEGNEEEEEEEEEPYVNEWAEDLLSDHDLSRISNSSSTKRRMVKRGGEEEGEEQGQGSMERLPTREEERMKKEESSATLWMDDENENDNVGGNNQDECLIHEMAHDYDDDHEHDLNPNDSFELGGDISMSKESTLSSIYNFGYDSSFCKNGATDPDQEQEQEILENENENIVVNILPEEFQPAAVLAQNTPFTPIDASTSTPELDEFSYHFEELFNESFSFSHRRPTEGSEMEPELELEPEVDLLDDFLNKSFTSTPSSRRNSILSYCSLVNDYSLEEGSSACPTSNASPKMNRSSPGEEVATASSPTPSPMRYTASSHQEFSIFPLPSPPPSPTPMSVPFASTSTTTSTPSSPVLLLNDEAVPMVEEGFHPLPLQTTSAPSSPPTLKRRTRTRTGTRTGTGRIWTSSPTLSSPSLLPSSSPSLSPSPSPCYRSFSPERIPPSPILQSLSVDRIFGGGNGLLEDGPTSCGGRRYSCTFHHVPAVATTHHPTSPTASTRTLRTRSTPSILSPMDHF